MDGYVIIINLKLNAHQNKKIFQIHFILFMTVKNGKIKPLTFITHFFYIHSLHMDYKF